MDQEQIDKLLDEMADKTESEIDKLFAIRLKALHERIAKLYRKYSNGGELTWTDLQKYNRFNKEMELIKQEIHNDYKQMFNNIEKLMIATYLENYLRSGFLYEFEAQQPMSYVIPSIETIRKAIANPIDKLKLPALMQDNRNEIIKKINIEISQGIMAGEGYSTIAKRLEDTVHFGAYKARRVARTETGRAQVEARLESAEHAEKVVGKAKPRTKEETEQAEPRKGMIKTWSSSGDLEVRSSHRILDDQEADEKGFFHFQGHKAQGPHLFHGPKSASLNINCRCDVLFLVDGKRPKLRRFRNYEDIEYQQKLANKIDKYMLEGMTEKQAEKKAKKEISPPSLVIEYQSYEDWFKTLPKGSKTVV
jgi:uncharacterized protein YoaH (UPF0181 family)